LLGGNGYIESRTLPPLNLKLPDGLSSRKVSYKSYIPLYVLRVKLTHCYGTVSAVSSQNLCVWLKFGESRGADCVTIVEIRQSHQPCHESASR